MDFDSLPNQASPGAAPGGQPSAAATTQPTTMSPQMDFDSLPDQSGSQSAIADQFSTPGQKLAAFGEGIGRGIVGPLAPMAERAMGVPASDIEARAKSNPWTAGAGEFTGFVGPAIASMGLSTLAKSGAITAGAMLAGKKALGWGTLGGLSEKAGQLATRAIGLTQPAGYLAKVGSSIVKNAAEMAVMASGDDAAKMAYDSDTANEGVEHAVANVGLMSAIGGTIGGLLTGAVSPLWNATNGFGLNKFMKGAKFHTNYHANKVAQAPALAAEGIYKPIEDGMPTAFSTLSSQVGQTFDPVLHTQLQKELQDQGFKFVSGMGNYTDRATGKAALEPMFFVEHGGTDEEKAAIDALGKKYNQQSVLHSNALPGIRINELRFMDGVTPSEKGAGAVLDPKVTADYTEIPGIGKYQLGLDPEGLHKEALENIVKRIAGRPSAKAVKIIAQQTGQEAAQDFAQDQYESLEDPDSVLNKAINIFGGKVEIPRLAQAAMNGEPRAIQWLNDLREYQHPETLAFFQQFPKQVQSALADKLDVSLDDLAHYSSADDGRLARNVFLKEYDQAHAPIAAEMEQRDANAMGLRLPESLTQSTGDAIIQKGMDEVGAKSPFFKSYQDYALRAREAESMKELYQMKSELRASARSLSENNNAKRGYNQMAQIIDDNIERELAKEQSLITNEGNISASDFINQKRMANLRYMNFSNMSNQLSEHFGLPEFRGAAKYKQDLRSLAPEDFLKKFSPSGDVEAIPFMQRYFPNTLKAVQQAEAKKFLSAAVKSDKGEPYLDVKMLNKRLAKLHQGAPEYAQFVMPGDQIASAQAAQTILDHIPGIKSSGTAGWASRLLNHLPASAVSTIAYLMGHNPVSAYIMEHLTNYLGREVPMATKLAYLKAMSSNTPEDAAALKAAKTMIQNSMRGNLKMARAVKSVFQPTPAVEVASNSDLRENREKLDKVIDDIHNNPSMMATYTQPRGSLGNIMPEHEKAMSQATMTQLNYLAMLKPKASQNSPFDRPIPPSDIAIQRYHNALDVANDPMRLMKAVKDGSISMNDKTDLQNLYPQVYQRMVDEMQNYMQAAAHTNTDIPYKTKVGISLFTGIPMDSSLQPQNILEAQKAFTKPAPSQAPVNPKRGTATLGKSNKTYRTPVQAAEQDRTGGRGE